MGISEYDYSLPDECIARFPAVERDQSRLLVLDRATDRLAHHRFCDLPDFLRPEDVLVLNDSRVLPARLRGRRQGTGGTVELLLVRREGDGTWLALGRPLRRLRCGAELLFGGGAIRGLVERRTEGERLGVRFTDESGAEVDPTAAGEVPLPPYLGRQVVDIDRERYQTVYADRAGSVAAPTAGLHFTDALLARIDSLGVAVERLLLHVGPGTFAPVRAADPREHRLEAEFYELSPKSAERIAARRRAGGRVVAVGTTVARTLETCAAPDGSLRPGSGWTELFIYPPYSFRVVDALVTNFHLPRSSLLMLVAALAGRERVLHAYREAVAAGYRFYSYGDAMLIV
ncbi:MAG: tRNA preQ1(34) S-adenosylmethionine ribosyltransferase-isomerase QueA [Gemmatimonadota bacterium]